MKLYISEEDPFAAQDKDGNEYYLNIEWPEDGSDPISRWKLLEDD